MNIAKVAKNLISDFFFIIFNFYTKLLFVEKKIILILSTTSFLLNLSISSLLPSFNIEIRSFFINNNEFAFSIIKYSLVNGDKFCSYTIKNRNKLLIKIDKFEKHTYNLHQQEFLPNHV